MRQPQGHIHTRGAIVRLKSRIKKRLPRLVSAYNSYRRMWQKAWRSVFPVLERDQLWAKLVGDLTDRVSDIFFVQIGAMDGVSFDPLYNYVVTHRWRGLLVEPLPDLFGELTKTYAGQKGLIFENVAIAEKAGKTNIYRVSPEAVEKGLVPYWAKGIATLLPDRNEIGGMGVGEDVFKQIQPYVMSQTVRCESLHNLIEKHGIVKIDILQVDAEGYDYAVLKQLDFDRFQPSIVRMEWSQLPTNERQLSLELLKKHRYRTRIFSDDLIAWRNWGMLSRILPKPNSLRLQQIFGS